MNTDNSSQLSGDISENDIQRREAIKLEFDPTYSWIGEQEYETPNGFYVNFDAIAAEISANTLRLGFTEPQHDKPTAELNGFEMQLAHMFRNILTPYSKACECIRKADFTGAIEQLEHLSLNASAHRKHMKQSLEVPNAVEQYRLKSIQPRSMVLHSKLALVPTELTEIYLNDDNLDDACDAIIRILSITGSMHYSVDEGLTREMAHNATRPPKHGKEA